MTPTARAACAVEDGGALVRIRFEGPKGNLLDATLTAALTAAFREAAGAKEARAVLLEAGGADFGFGASVAEHRPAEAPAMLVRFRALLAAMHAVERPIVVAVRGRCFGGALELALFCHRVVAAPDATFASPEPAVGAFAPVASLLLSERVPRGLAEEVLLGGRRLTGDEAARAGLVEAVADDPSAAALAWARERLTPLSASVLGVATAAARAAFAERFFADLEALERLYAERLLPLADAAEGPEAFLAKRAPRWTHR
ncbi:MAG TPA: enoyl-CoA hydratase/isomerase family protein [Planctomycetota bacterium]|nr:enoyl-CoA hydratase/isomerase family protein [Planctomycetota bacterium]